MNQVKVFDGAGNLKEVISGEKVSKQFWATVTSSNLKASQGWEGETRECKECGAEFLAETKTQVFCKRNVPQGKQCSKIFYARKIAVKKVEKVCANIKCSNAFMGYRNRRYCNNPCRHGTDKKANGR